jgi:putative acetyltransferase
MADTPLRIALEPARQPEVIQLIADLDAYQKPLYPPESHYGIDLDALSKPEVIFAVAREGGHAVGCAAVVLDLLNQGEIKRMYVAQAARGTGAARGLLDLLQAEALQRSCRVLRLETGIHQHEAIHFYQRMGFTRCGRFGSYPEDPLSVFMVKALVSQPLAEAQAAP